MRAFAVLSRQLSEVEGTMARCPQCSGYLTWEPEFMDTPARVHCIACAWRVYDPRFRTEEERYFPSDSTDRRIERRNENPGYDLYEPRSAACQLKISVSYLKDRQKRQLGTGHDEVGDDSLQILRRYSRGARARNTNAGRD